MVDITNQPPDPLRINVRIVDIEGKPTQEFLRQWNQQRVINVTVDDIVVDLTALQADVTALEAEVDDIQDVDIVAGVGLDGGGNISGPTDVTLDLADTAVTPGTYGNATNSAQVTIDQQGRITAAANIPITGGGGGSGSGGGSATPPTRTSQSLSGSATIDITIPPDCTWFEFGAVDVTMSSASGDMRVGLRYSSTDETFSGFQVIAGTASNLSAATLFLFNNSLSGTSRDYFGRVIQPRQSVTSICESWAWAGSNLTQRKTVSDTANQFDTIRVSTAAGTFSSGTFEVTFYYN